MEQHDMRLQARAWIEERVEDHTSVPELAEGALAHFRKQPSFVDTFLDVALYGMLYEITKKVLMGTRHDAVLLGEEVVSRNEFEVRSYKLAKRFARWMEHAGEDHHVRLMKMSRRQLRVAIQERKGRIETEQRVVNLMERIEHDLTSDEEVVEDRFSAEDLAEMWQELESEVRV